MFTQMSSEKTCEGLRHSSRCLKADGTPAAFVEGRFVWQTLRVVQSSLRLSQ